MTADTRDSSILDGASRDDIVIRSDIATLRTTVIAAGLGGAVLFIVIGLAYQLQMYADGSIFSYAVAVQDAWAFHWRNISGRLFVYLYALLPAETYVALTGDARGGIAVYGLLHFTAPLLGLAATYAADRSKGRIIFVFACASTACLCPIVFGFPTELWMAHSLFWPALAVCHDTRGGAQRLILVFALLLALVLTHAGALIFGLAILATLLLRGPRDEAFLRASGAFLAAVAIWILVKTIFPPGDYFRGIIVTAALNLINIRNFADEVFLLLLTTLAGYGIAFLTVSRLNPAKAHVLATWAIAFALAVYWLWFDRSLHAGERYELRTALLAGTPALGALAAAFALDAEGRLRLQVPFLPQFMTLLRTAVAARLAAGAVVLVMLVHAVETAKFVTAWTDYKAAVRTLATGTTHDPALGDRNFVSSARIRPDINRLSWFSTTPYLSVLLAPQFAPRRLVVDPNGGYFWLSCARAAASQAANHAIPTESRRLIRVYSCLHR